MRKRSLRTASKIHRIKDGAPFSWRAEKRPPGLKPKSIPCNGRAPKGPLFHNSSTTDAGLKRPLFHNSTATDALKNRSFTIRARAVQYNLHADLRPDLTE